MPQYKYYDVLSRDISSSASSVLLYFVTKKRLQFILYPVARQETG